MKVNSDGSSTYAPFELSIEPSDLGLRSYFRQTKFGRLHYLTNDSASSTGLLFLHGVGGTWTTWTPVLKAAAVSGLDLGSICLVDLPGFGLSENKTGELESATVGEMLFELTRFLGWPSYILVGHSMGGFLALDMASANSDGLKGLISISGTYFSVLNAVQHRCSSIVESPDAFLLLKSMSVLSWTGRLAPHILYLLDRGGLLTHLLARGAARPSDLPVTFVQGLVAGIRPRSFMLAADNGRNYDAQERWNHISVPAVATFGRQDKLVPAADFEETRSGLPQLTTVMFEDCGHFAPVERPFDIIEILGVAERWR